MTYLLSQPATRTPEGWLPEDDEGNVSLDTGEAVARGDKGQLANYHND